MRFIFLCSMVFLSLFAGDIEIEKNKVFQISVIPNMYTSTFSLSSKDKEQSNIENSFEKVISIVSKSTICKGGKYNIYPHHKKDEYNGYINFNCKFEDKKVYEDILSEIKLLDNIKISQGRINQINDSNIIEVTNERLESMALKFPSTYEKFLENNMKGFTCKIKKISFRGSSHISPLKMEMKSSRVMDTQVTLPVKSNVTYNKSADYSFICKK